MSQCKGYCSKCSQEVWFDMPGYVCTVCGRSNEPDDGPIGFFFILALIFVALVFVAFLAVNSVMVLFSLIFQPWGPVGSYFVMKWLWLHDNLAAESKRFRYGVTAFIGIWIATYIVGIVGHLWHLELIALIKDLLIVALPGAAVGYASTYVIERLRGKMWPAFMGICLFHTLGRVTFLGWIMGSF